MLCKLLSKGQSSFISTEINFCGGRRLEQPEGRQLAASFTTSFHYQHIPEASAAGSAGWSHRLPGHSGRGKGAGAAGRALSFQWPAPETSCGHQTLQAPITDSLYRKAHPQPGKTDGE